MDSHSGAMIGLWFSNEWWGAALNHLPPLFCKSVLITLMEVKNQKQVLKLFSALVQQSLFLSKKLNKIKNLSIGSEHAL